MGDITVIGSANLDTTMYVEKFPDDIEKKVDSSGKVKQCPGGKGANQALAIKKQMEEDDISKVHFLGCIGKDQNGLRIGESLKNGGVDISRMKLADKKSDGRLVFVCTEGKDKGKNRMIGSGDCISEITPEYLEKNIDVIDSSELVMIQLKMPKESIKFIIDYCHEHEKDIIVDPAPENKIEFLVQEGLLDKITYLTPNSDEAYVIKKIQEGHSFEDINAVLKEGIPKEEKISEIKELVSNQKNVIATVGNSGVIYADENGEVKQKATYKDKPIDTTGAGDTFNGAFAAAIHRKEKIDDAIELGLAASSAKVLHEGAQNGVPTLKETREKIKKEYDLKSI